MNQSSTEIPQLKSAAQFGGCYVQVVPFGDWVVASRIGGLQVFADQKQLTPVDECALTVVPDLQEEQGVLFAVCRTKTFMIFIDARGRIVLKQTNQRVWNINRHQKSELNTPFGRFVLDKPTGTIETPSGRRLKLPGYSRPAWVSCHATKGIVYVADVGRIHRLVLRNNDWQLEGGFECDGWPKDVACVSDNVFVANVFGVSWYKEQTEYPYLRLQDRLSRFHFRAAKVSANETNVFVCDEARGVHVFSTKNGRLMVCGGVFVDGGGWDFLPIGKSGYLASGAGGWRWYENFEDLISGSITKTEFHAPTSKERIQGVKTWSFLDSVVVMSSNTCRIFRSHTDAILFDYACNAWSGVAIGEHFVVATESGLLLLAWNEDKCRIELVDHAQFEEARDVCWDGQLLWVASGRQGIRCFALNNDDHSLCFVGCFPVCGFSRGIFRTKDRIYVGAGDGGLVVIKM